MHFDTLFNETLTILNVIDGAVDTVLYKGMRNLNEVYVCFFKEQLSNLV